MNNQNEPNIKKDEEVVEEVINESSLEENKETVPPLEEIKEDNSLEETINVEQVEDALKEHQVIENKKLKMTFIKILLYFVLSSIIYVICKAYDPFSNVTSNAEIQSIQLLNYISIVMYISFAISALLLIAFILYTCGIKLKIKTRIVKVGIEVLDWFAILPICIAVTSICFTFLFTFTVVDGDSMKPTLRDGEQLLLTYGKNFERFDIIVCEVESAGQNVLFVKRIIGLPGETVDYKFNVETGDTDLYINGVLVNEPFYSNTHQFYEYTAHGGYDRNPFNWDLYVEKYKSQLVLNEQGEYVIPDDCYFILGDNRTNSIDSRVIGLVKKENILGQINYRLHSIFEYEKLV